MQIELFSITHGTTGFEKIKTHAYRKIEHVVYTMLIHYSVGHEDLHGNCCHESLQV